MRSYKRATEALKHIPEDEADFADSEVPASDPASSEEAAANTKRLKEFKAAQRAAVAARLSSALDWLCLHVPKQDMPGRGLHSFTSQLNLSAFEGIGGARRGCVARVKGLLRGV